MLEQHNVLTLEQIEQQMAALQAQKEAIRKQNLAEVISVVKDLIKQHGLTARDVFEPKAKSAGVVAPKYRNTANPEQTWTGRGKMPVWLAQATAAGHALDSFLIAPAAAGAPADAEAEALDDEAEAEGAY